MLRLDLYGFARDADHRGVRRYRSHQHGAGADPAMAADGHRAEDRRAAEDRHRVLDGGVALDALCRGAAQRDALVDRHIVADLTRLSDHDAHAVINEKTPADFRSGMDLDAGKKAADVAHKPRQRGEAALPEPMCHPVN